MVEAKIRLTSSSTLHRNLDTKCNSIVFVIIGYSTRNIVDIQEDVSVSVNQDTPSKNKNILDVARLQDNKMAPPERAASCYSVRIPFDTLTIWYHLHRKYTV